MPHKYNVYHVGQGNNTTIQLNSEGHHALGCVSSRSYQEKAFVTIGARLLQF